MGFNFGYGDTNQKILIFLYVIIGIIVCITTYNRMDDLLIAILAGAAWPVALLYYTFYKFGSYIFYEAKEILSNIFSEL